MSELRISESNITSPQIDFDLLDRWIEALESGEYEQGQQQLRTPDNKYCCLGVLCDVSGLGAWNACESEPNRIEWIYETNIGNGCAHVPGPLAAKVGILPFGDKVNREDWKHRSYSPASLIQANDTDFMTFPEIAQMLREYRDDLKEAANQAA